MNILAEESREIKIIFSSINKTVQELEAEQLTAEENQLVSDSETNLVPESENLVSIQNSLHEDV